MEGRFIKRTIFRVIKNPKSTTNEDSRIAVVDFHDGLGMLRMDIPVLPRGTVIKVGPFPFKKEPIGISYWEVEGYETNSSTDRDEGLLKIKDIAGFYKKTKDVIPMRDFNKICETYAGNLCFYFKENPYFMFSPSFFDDETIAGLSVRPKDIAKISPLNTFEERRQEIASFIHYELLLAERSGDTGVSFRDLRRNVSSELSSVGQPLTSMEEEYFSAFINYSNACQDRYDDTCRFFMDTGSFTEETLVFRHVTYAMEQGIYDRAANFLSSPCIIKCPEYSEEGEGLNLSTEQAKAVHGVFMTDKEEQLGVKKGNLCIITGGPGTGKTTVIKEIIRCAVEKDSTIKIKIVAPTGSASKRIKESVGGYAVLNNIEISTIHRLVGYKKRDSALAEEKIRESSLVIIDESSMLSLEVFKMLLDKADPSKTKIILIGDKDQLPSVDAGDILVDLINLGVPTFYLRQNFRSSGAIVRIASKINKGIASVGDLVPVRSAEDIPPQPGTYFIDISKRPQDSIKNELSDFACKSEEEGYKWVILSAKKEQGVFSSASLNMAIAGKLRGRRLGGTPWQQDKQGGSLPPGAAVYSYAVGDRVIACRTSYNISENNSYYNGDTGILQDGYIGNGEIEYEVALDGENSPTYIHSADLSLAYALTIHKSQGREYDTVCLVLPHAGTGDRFVTKKLLYTAVTRAKSRLIIWSTPHDFATAVLNMQGEKRKTLLSTKPRFPSAD